MSRIKEINAADLDRLIQTNDHFELVDIRTPAEISRGVIPNSKTLPMHLIPLNLNYFSISSKQIVLYCRTGSRSAQACRFLNQQGIHNVISLRGGMIKWTNGGLPIDPEPAGAIE
ncbi:MAG: rhodanese-like domain-containing protein [Gammaproteobacteria bacterium]|nr:MAG: rhodanese-like domain-containing protein [Gammaproteobacteria bacterium]